MPDLNDSDASVTSALSATLALPPGPASLTSPASSEPPSADDSTASEADLDIPPLDPIIDPIGHRRTELERLGERIAELSSRIQAATYDLLVLIREFDAQIGWSGWTSCAHWLSWRTGLAPGAAREHVRVARALGNLPKLSDAMRRGAVSYSKVRAVTRVATPETEQALLDVAQSGTAAHVEQIVRGWRRVDRTAERTEEKRRQDRRSLRTWVDDDGMVVVQGRLTPEVGAALRRALEAACDQAQARRAAENGGTGTALDAAVDATAPDVAMVEEELAPTFAQRQADAIGVVAECALAGGLDRGTAGDRYQVMVHVDSGALADEQYVPAGTPAPGSAPAAQSQTVLDEAGGIHVSAETARRLACDAAKVEMRHGPDGEILGVGRRTRTISPALRRALAARDGQCRFPGCQNRRCDAHHVQHWADGGETALDNLVLLCRRHHRAVHEEGFRITLDAAGDVQFMRPDGQPFPAAPPAPLWTGAALAPVTERLEREGVDIDSEAAPPAWKGERVDIGWAVGLLWKPQPDAPSAHTNS